MMWVPRERAWNRGRVQGGGAPPYLATLPGPGQALHVKDDAMLFHCFNLTSLLFIRRDTFNVLVSQVIFRESHIHICL